MKAVVTAYAKINLVLDVLRKRDDDYHEVAMVMQAINLADQLIISPAKVNELKSENPYIPMNMNNLAMKAVTLMQQNFSYLPPMSVTIHKRIPVAAGLGGGSADGAAVLMGINALFHLKLRRKELQGMAAELGSDVPFCLVGPTALATGRGEFIRDLPPCPRLWLVLVKPVFGVSTLSVYKNLDLSTIAKHPDVANCLMALKQRNIHRLLSGMGNILEQSTFGLHPAVAALKQDMVQLGGQYTLMSGSGPTIFSAFTNAAQAKSFYKLCRKKYKQVYLTHTVDPAMMKRRVTITHD